MDNTSNKFPFNKRGEENQNSLYLFFSNSSSVSIKKEKTRVDHGSKRVLIGTRDPPLASIQWSPVNEEHSRQWQAVNWLRLIGKEASEIKKTKMPRAFKIRPKCIWASYENVQNLLHLLYFDISKSKKHIKI